jgi:hypothetical protein
LALRASRSRRTLVGTGSYACALRRLPIGDAPCMSLASELRKLLMLACDEPVVPPSAETRLLKLVCRSLKADDVADVADVAEVAVAADVAVVAEAAVVPNAVDAAVVEESLESAAANCSTRLCNPPPPPCPPCP